MKTSQKGSAIDKDCPLLREHPSLLALSGLSIMATLLAGLLTASKAEITFANAPESLNQTFPFPPAFPPAFPLSPSVPFGGVQVVRSLLGLRVAFLNGNVNYAGLTIVNDPRYQALGTAEKLVDAIAFRPAHAPPFLILIAIAKGSKGEPAIIPGKFEVVRKTDQEGLILRDPHKRLFYYSGYTLAAPAWKSLLPGEMLQDKFCKEPVPMTLCPSQSAVSVILKKPLDPNKDIPFLALIK